MLSIVLLILGLALLTWGADLLVGGASNLAAKAGISSLVIGLTVVAFGTSSPEMAVSVYSSLKGGTVGANLAVGNVVGSNILNILLILGICAVLTPLAISRQLVKVDVPIMIGASALVYAMALNGTISRAEGSVLFLGVIGYTIFSVRLGKLDYKNTSEAAAAKGEERYCGGSSVVDLFFVIAGIAILVIGSDLLVAGAVRIAKVFGVSELIIALTIISLGTSLPELATSLVASFKDERDIAVGNIVGSCIFNLFSVLGMSAVVSSGGLPISGTLVHFDIPLMLAASFVCLPFFFTGYIISRKEGFVFLLSYVAYIFFLAKYISRPSCSTVMLDKIMLWGIAPICISVLLFVFLSTKRRSAQLHR